MEEKQVPTGTASERVKTSSVKERCMWSSEGEEEQSGKPRQPEHNKTLVLLEPGKMEIQNRQWSTDRTANELH